MAKMLLPALAAVLIVAGTMPIDRGAATTATSPAAIAPAHLIREAAVICAGNGCNVVQTKAIKHRKFKPLEYTKPIPKAS